MKGRYLIIFFILTFSYLHGFAQNRIIDSLKQVLKTEDDDTNKVKTLSALCIQLRTDSTTAFQFARQAYKLAEKLQFGKGMITALVAEETGLYQNTDWDNDLKIELRMIDLCKKYDSSTESFHNHFTNTLNACYELGNYPKAVEIALEGIKLGEKRNNKKIEAYYTYQMYAIYGRMGNIPKAKEYLLKSMDLDNANGNQKKLAVGYKNLAELSEAEGSKKQALNYSLKALDIYNKQKASDRSFADLYNLISEIYKDTGDFPHALEYSLKCLEKGDTTKGTDVFTYPLYLLNNGEIYMKLNEYGKASKDFDKAVHISRNVKNSMDMENALYDIAQLKYKQGDFKKAYDNFLLYTSIKDSANSVENNRKVAELNTIYETGEKEKEIELLNSDKEKQAAIAAEDNKRHNIVMGFIGAIAFAVAFIALIIFRSLKITRKQKQNIESKNKVIEEKNKDILDSINYAKRLQDAILPPLSSIKQYFPESFLFYKPKDIVAGDFYWLERSGDTIFIAAADCTGHGVPGALVSVVCSNALNRTVKEFKITEPGKILDKVRELVLETFGKSESNVQDGMDISLCSINTQTKAVQWSGAYNYLWYIQNGEIYEVPADKQPIGKIEKPIPFNTHNLNLQKGDTLYLLTDGYADQFGGPKGKKFKYKQMEELLLAHAGKPMEEQKNILETTLHNWKGNLEQVDDILVIGLRV